MPNISLNSRSKNVAPGMMLQMLGIDGVVARNAHAQGHDGRAGAEVIQHFDLAGSAYAQVEPGDGRSDNPSAPRAAPALRPSRSAASIGHIQPIGLRRVALPSVQGASKCRRRLQQCFGVMHHLPVLACARGRLSTAIGFGLARLCKLCSNFTTPSMMASGRGGQPGM